MPYQNYVTERLITILESVNATAIDNHGGHPGEYLAEVCQQAARQLRAYHCLLQDKIEERKKKSTTPIKPDPRQIDLEDAIAAGDSGC